MLTTERLVYREFSESDWGAVWEYQNDPLYLRYSPYGDPTPEETRTFVQMFLDQQRQTPRLKFQFVLVRKTDRTERLIGNCGIRVNEPEQREANIGYELDSRYWGNGYATEAAREMLRYGFEELEMHRIWAACLFENIESARVLERIGMRREALFREKHFFAGRWWDESVYALLASEWRQGERNRN